MPELDDDLFMVFHLMIAGRFRWRDRGVKIPGRNGLAAFDFPSLRIAAHDGGVFEETCLPAPGPW